MPGTPTTLAGLLVQQTAAQIYAGFLSLATTLGLPVTSWLAGDPTRSLYFGDSNFLVQLEQVVVGFIQSGFLDYAAQPVNDANGNPLPIDTRWLNLLAQQQYGVTVPTATFATTSVILTNFGGGYYELDANGGDVQLQNSTTGATYTTTTGGVLGPVGTPQAQITVTVIADAAGSASTASPGEIDAVVTNLLGVTCTNPAAAVGNDQQSPETTIQQCRNKQGSLSPNGPAAAYDFVALNATLTGVQTPKQVRSYADSETGDVLVYVCGVNGSALGSGDVAAVQSAINQWATPLCVTATVATATPVPVNVAYTVWVYSSVNQASPNIEAAIQTALGNFFSGRPIGGDIIPPATTGFLFASEIEAAIGATFPEIFRTAVSAPTVDVSLANNQVAVLGVVTPTINIIPDP